jgi:nucleoid-associated protein YgaU
MTTKHKVVAGDTLSALALQFYGDASLYEVISIANGIPDPDVIKVGQILLIPGLTRKYKVVAGDSLWRLAERFYGDGSLFTLIAAANHIADPDVIQAGSTLRIPEL